MQKRINIKEFAQHVGVSTATISRAFSEKGRISEKTRQRILRKADELGYRANFHARNLSSQQTKTIGLFYPEVGTDHPNYFLQELELGIQTVLLNNGKLLQTHPLPPDHPDERFKIVLETILCGGLDGVIVVAGSETATKLIATARSVNLPYMVIGHMKDEATYCIQFDSRNGACLAGNYFRKTGKKHPVYISGYLDTQKKRGFAEGMQTAADQLPILTGGHTFNDGMSAFHNLRAQRPETDCVLCANDTLAAGFIRAAITAGVSIPEDLAVIGFDDVTFARYITPSLSSVSLQLQTVGSCAANNLLTQLNGEEIHMELIACDLLIRESS